ncbi:MAG: pitrilysin family protein [Calditrichia bacterium]
MKLINLMTLLLLMVFAGNLLAGDVQDFEINGLKVIFKQNKSNDIIAAQLYFKGGSMVLNNQNSGIENFALSVAQKATKNYPKDKLNGELEKMNTKVTHSVTLDYSSLNLQCVKQNFKKSWELFSDIILSPTFNPEDVELVRQQQLAALRQQKDDPDNYLGLLSLRALYVDHPYAVGIGGTEETVSQFTAEDLRSYYQSRLETSQLLLVVVGNTSLKELKKLVEKTFSGLPVGQFTNPKPPMPEPDAPSLKLVKRDLPTTYVQGSFAAPEFGSPESYAMMIATSILRDRLFEEVRTKRGLSYAPGAGMRSRFAPYGYIYVTAVDPDSTIRVMRDETEKLTREAVSASDLRNKINMFITRFFTGNETNMAQAGWLARYELSGLGYQAADQIINELKKLTPELLQQTAEKYIKNLQFVLIGNPKSLKTERFLF